MDEGGTARSEGWGLKRLVFSDCDSVPSSALSALVKY
jgi:hypothetical protein